MPAGYYILPFEFYVTPTARITTDFPAGAQGNAGIAAGSFNEFHLVQYITSFKALLIMFSAGLLNAPYWVVAYNFA